MSDNLEFYSKLATPPSEALKAITAGRLKGKTDINPQWRIKAMTEQFGMCGFGWKYAITKQWTEEADNNQVFAFINVDLFVKINDTWSDAIPGTGGTLLIINERNGAYSDDEAFKKSLTDALGVAMKALGMGSDVYMGLMDNGGDNSGSKYQGQKQQNQTNFIQREVTGAEVKNKWNGVIYKGNVIYIDNNKIQIPEHQVDKLKKHEKYHEKK